MKQMEDMLANEKL